MDRAETIRVLRALSDGVDPQTGEMLATGGVVDKPIVLRALFDALAALDPPHAPSPRGRAENHGKPWTSDEDEALARDFDAGRPVADLARDRARSKTAIRQRLQKLGRIDA